MEPPPTNNPEHPKENVTNGTSTNTQSVDAGPSASGSHTHAGQEEEQNDQRQERKSYIAWPRETGLNHELNARGYSALVSIATASRIHTSDTIDMGVNFWRCEMTEEEAARAREIPEVAAIYPEATPEQAADPFC